jgi:heptosyltransferase-2
MTDRNGNEMPWDALVWLQTGFLGDIVLTTAAFNFVREHYPMTKQIVVTTPIGAAALKDHPDLDGILVFDKRNKSLWSEAKRLRREILRLRLGRTWVMQTHRSFRSSFLCRLIGLPTVSYHESQGSFLATKRVHRVAVLHEAQRILLLLESLGAERALITKALPYLSAAHDEVILKSLREFAGHRPLIALAPGSVWGTKRWPSENYGELSRLILQRSEAAIVIIGSKDEVPAAKIVENTAGDPSRVMNLAGQTSLDDLRSIFPSFQVLVSNDSSPLHYASAFRTPTLAIFGATVPALGFGPLAPRRYVAELELSCRPCGAHGPMTCPLGHFRCMKDQGPEQMMDHLIRHFGDLMGPTPS